MEDPDLSAKTILGILRALEVPFFIKENYEDHKESLKNFLDIVFDGIKSRNTQTD